MQRTRIIEKFQSSRAASERLCAPLAVEDFCIQSSGDVSPPKWHLGHTSWFYERAILQEHIKNYSPVNESFYKVFNSYYVSFGERVPRDIRGTLSRPTVGEVVEYRKTIDERMHRFLTTALDEVFRKIEPLVELGINHEEQHQELLVTDIKHILLSNPLKPCYHSTERPFLPAQSGAAAASFLAMPEQLLEIGHQGEGFAWDNEFPRHKVFIGSYAIQNRTVLSEEYLEFILDGGYRKPLLWLSEGWDWVQQHSIRAPLYWTDRDGEWWIDTLEGILPAKSSTPVCHVSYFEADAFARWCGKQLPTEFEWEAAAMSLPLGQKGALLEDGAFHPLPVETVSNDEFHRSEGDVWEWTGSSYLPYPGYNPVVGPLGEYNAKFMINQMVLRGGSCATPAGHCRPTYRNFFQTEKRWQFKGIRLVERGR